MSVLTRIKNNQILDSTIYANAKIVPGSIVGSLFNTNLTMTSDVTITGNLTVQGASTYLTVASTNTYVNDPLIVLNNAFSGTNTYDLGFVFNRGSLQNQALIWNEFNKEFRLVGTTETGTTYGNINQSNSANLRIGNLTVDYVTSIGSLITTGFINTSGNISAATGLFGAVNSTGLINTTGNLSASQVSVATINATGFINTAGNVSAAIGLFGAINSTGLINTTGNLSAVTINAATVNTSGNVLAAVFNGGALNVSGNVAASTVLAQLVTADDATFGNVVAGFVGNTGTEFTGASINLSGNVLASTVLAQLVTADDATIGNLAAGFVGNAGTVYTGATINLSGNVIGGLAQFASINSTPIGNATPSTGVFTTTTAGAVNAPFIGNTGAVFTGASLNVTGNVLSTGGIFNALTVNGTGDFTTLTATGNVIGGLGQFAALNATPIGNATASTGSFTVLAASNNLWANASIATTAQGIGAVVVPNGGISVAGAANVASTLTIGGATQLNSTLAVGGITTFTNSTNATTINDGAVIIQGGASVLKDLYVGGNLYAANIIGITANVITVEDPLVFFKPSYTFPYNYDIGFYSAFTGTGLTTAGNVTQHTAVIRNNSDNTWTFASNLAEPGAGFVVLDNNTVYDPIKAGNLTLVNTTASTTTGTGALIVAGGAGIAGAVTAGSFNTAGNVLASDISGASLNVSGNVSATELNTGTIKATGLINTLGNVSASVVTAGQFNTTGNLSASQVSTATLNATGLINTLGNISASRINADTLAATGTIWANSSTASTNTSTGALVLAGGLGLAGNIFQGGAYLDTSSSNYILAGTPTTVDAFKAATDLEIGATSGTFTINNPTLVGTQTTQALYDTVTDTLNFARTANITMGHTSGIITLQGNANVRAVTRTTTFTTGALVVAGGGGFGGNIAIVQGSQFLVGSEITNKVLVPSATAQFFSNVNTYSQINQQNVNSGNVASSDFVATADNGNDVQGYIDLGINSSTFNQSYFSVAGANDGYLYVSGNTTTGGGNLAIGTANPNNDIVFFTGNLTSQYISMRINDNTSIGQPNVHITLAGWTTSLSDGGFVVDTGAAIGANLRVGSDAIFNYTQSLSNFTIRTTGSTAGLIYNVANQSLILNGPGYASNVTPVPGATLAVRATDSMLIPVGSTAQRPGNTGNIDVTGMLRYNTSISNLEWYDGSLWSVPGSAQTTVITDESFSGNGVQTAFTLANASSTNSCIVSVNGVLQIPVTAYGITGTTLTFTEAPAVGDAINVRKITTTASITSLSSANGYMVFDVSDPSGIYANITGGTSAATPRISTNAEGLVSIVNDAKIVARGSQVNIVANATPYALDSFTQTRYVTAKYIVSAKKDSTNFESYEALVTTDQNGNAYITTYGIVNNGTTMGILSANVLAGNVQLYYTTNTNMTNANIRVYTTYIQ